LIFEDKWFRTNREKEKGEKLVVKKYRLVRGGWVFIRKQL